MASQLEKTPLGFGELIYNDGSVNQLNGLMIKQIAHVGDSLMMGTYNAGVHVFANPNRCSSVRCPESETSSIVTPLDT